MKLKRRRLKMPTNKFAKVKGIHKVPEVLVREFEQNPLVYFPIGTAGLWPIGPEIIKNAEFMNRLARDQEFQKNFVLVAMPVEK
jgi:hypothetical protein